MIIPVFMLQHVVGELHFANPPIQQAALAWNLTVNPIFIFALIKNLNGS